MQFQHDFLHPNLLQISPKSFELLPEIHLPSHRLAALGRQMTLSMGPDLDPPRVCGGEDKEMVNSYNSFNFPFCLLDCSAFLLSPSEEVFPFLQIHPIKQS